MSSKFKNEFKQSKINNKNKVNEIKLELKREKENEFINNKLMNIEDNKIKELKRDKEYENKIRRKIILKKEIKNELDNNYCNHLDYKF